tara:strand:+ start:485 stop:1000 length:516 start_codon:yes stop_codon:yes gene_type:complete
MKIQTKANFNFHKLTEDNLRSMISNLMTVCAFAAKDRIEEGFEKEFDINGIGFEPNAFKYAQDFKLQGTPIMTNTGKLRGSIEVVAASSTNRTSKVGSDVDYGEDHFEDRIGFKNTLIPARIWFFTTGNLGGESDTFLKQYADVLSALVKATKTTYIPHFLRFIKTSMRSL